MPDLRWLAVTPTPTPTAPPPESVTPGIAGFIGIAVVAIVVVLLALDMLRRIRRAQYRVDVNEQLDAEERAQRDDDRDGPASATDEPGDDLSPGSPTRG